MDDESITRESIIRHSPNDLPTNDPYWKVLDALQDSAMWFQQFLGDPQPHSTLRNMDLEQSSKTSTRYLRQKIKPLETLWT